MHAAISPNATFLLASEDELMVITEGTIKEIKLERKYHPKKQRLLYEMTERQIGERLNMTCGSIFRENEKEMKIIMEDKTTHQLREIKLIK